MDPDVLGDLVAPSRRDEAPAYRHTIEPARSQSYDSLCTTAWQTANLLRLYGVHEGATVGVVDAPKHPERTPSTDRATARISGTPLPEVLTAFLGASLLGAGVRFDPDRSFEGAALLCPAAWLDHYDVSPDCTVLAYGGPPEDPSVVHFESEVWSETPIAPPESIQSDAVALVTADDAFDHSSLLSAAARVVEDHGITAGDAVEIEAQLSYPGTVAAGVIAPLLAGATIQVGDGVADHTVGSEDIDPEAVTLRPTDGRSSRA